MLNACEVRPESALQLPSVTSLNVPQVDQRLQEDLQSMAGGNTKLVALGDRRRFECWLRADEQRPRVMAAFEMTNSNHFYLFTLGFVRFVLFDQWKKSLGNFFFHKITFLKRKRRCSGGTSICVAKRVRYLYLCQSFLCRLLKSLNLISKACHW